MRYFVLLLVLLSGCVFSERSQEREVIVKQRPPQTVIVEKHRDPPPRTVIIEQHREPPRLGYEPPHRQGGGVKVDIDIHK